jgi:hypothetical protein
MNTRNFFAELKRRNVYKVAVAYAVVSWLLIQIATQVFPFFDIPNWAVRVVVLLLALGFPVALVLAWAFEITPEGIRRESEITPHESITYHTCRKLIGITIAVAVAAGGMLAFQLLRLRSRLFLCRHRRFHLSVLFPFCLQPYWLIRWAIAPFAMKISRACEYIFSCSQPFRRIFNQGEG